MAFYFPTAAVGNTNVRRTLGQDFSSMKEMVDSGNSHSHSLPLTLEKGFSRNFFVLAFHTWSTTKAPTTNSPSQTPIPPAAG